MKNVLLIGTAVFLAYKLGEKQAQMTSQDYFITRKLQPSPSVTITEYVRAEPTGITFTTDENLATPFFFFDAYHLKNLIKKFAPGSNLRLETANHLIPA